MLAGPEDRLAVEAIEKLTGGKIEQINIDGLDTVEWSEGRGKRGRGRAAPAEKSGRGKSDDKKSEKPRADKDKPARKPELAAEPKAEADMRPAREHRPKPERKPVVVAAPLPLDAPQPDTLPVRPAVIERNFERPRDRDRDRGGRERFRRDDDLGPSVLGFGDEVPAFMLVAALPKRHHVKHEIAQQDATDTED
jgi:hypothetical protein